MSLQGLLKDLALLEHHVSRSVLVQRRCREDEAHYRSVQEAIGAAPGGGLSCHVACRALQ
jgi:hypothetical protein